MKREADGAMKPCFTWTPRVYCRHTGASLAQAETTLACVDARSLKPAAAPQALRACPGGAIESVPVAAGTS